VLNQICRHLSGDETGLITFVKEAGIAIKGEQANHIHLSFSICTNPNSQ
jgi:hypothetical protein